MCVCVESLEVALNFHHTIRFEHVTNAYIPSREYFPVGYGQLGCSGFVVSDRNGCFVTRKSPAYLQYGEAAFRHVESMLAKLLLLSPDEPSTSDERDSTAKRKREVQTSDKSKVGPSIVSSSDDSEEEKEKETNKKIQPPPLVGIDSMDDEHKELTMLFNRLLDNPSSTNLMILYEELASHFDHEEQLISQYCGNNNNKTNGSSFSAIDSHKRDHDRILNICREELNRVNNNNNSGCSTGS